MSMGVLCGLYVVLQMLSRKLNGSDGGSFCRYAYGYKDMTSHYYIMYVSRNQNDNSYLMNPWNALRALSLNVIIMMVDAHTRYG
eukprot:6213343-Pleurochrysis_carterae.AAC.6